MYLLKYNAWKEKEGKHKYELQRYAVHSQCDKLYLWDKDNHFWIDHITLRIYHYARGLSKTSLADVENDVFSGMRAQGLWYTTSF